MFGNESVFKRASGTDELTANSYNLLVGLTLLWGFVINFLMVKFIPVSVIAGIHPVVFILAYFALCITGCVMFTKSDDSKVSFAGYNLVVVPFGFIINLVVGNAASGVVLNSIIATGFVTCVMLLVSTIYPKALENILLALLIALVTAIVIELTLICVTGRGSKFIDWAVILIFCGYIGFDWSRANSIPKTVNNAIDSAAALYMDIINIFVRFVGISSKD